MFKEKLHEMCCKQKKKRKKNLALLSWATSKLIYYDVAVYGAD